MRVHGPGRDPGPMPAICGFVSRVGREAPTIRLTGLPRTSRTVGFASATLRVVERTTSNAFEAAWNGSR